MITSREGSKLLDEAGDCGDLGASLALVEVFFVAAFPLRLVAGGLSGRC
jgi:hypothetical protein